MRDRSWPRTTLVGHGEPGRDDELGPGHDREPVADLATDLIDLLALAADATSGDAILFVWWTSDGIQPVLMPRFRGSGRSAQAVS